MFPNEGSCRARLAILVSFIGTIFGLVFIFTIVARTIAYDDIGLDEPHWIPTNISKTWQIKNAVELIWQLLG